MPDEAVEMITKAQPYQREGSELETLSLISRLENADKHRSPITVSHGVTNARSTVTVKGETITQGTDGFRKNGAEIAKFGFQDRALGESEVTVKVSCTAAIAIKVPGIDGHFTMPECLEILIGWVRDSAIPELAPFTRPN
jgi:hypothetical protein